jgi:hypothetical protein
MRQLLSKHRPNKHQVEFAQWWDNAGWGLEPLACALAELAGDGTIGLDELKGGDALATLAYQAGRRAAYLDVLNMLPESAKQSLPRRSQEIDAIRGDFADFLGIIVQRAKKYFTAFFR